MEYLASEIIERAKNLADMGNTDYISHKELIQYLNDSYSYVYQLAINRGDNFFVKYRDLGVGLNRLPKDFYQLRCIKNKYDGHLFTRKPLNGSINEPGYEIINNKINISGINANCEMTYYPEPKLLTFPNKEKILENSPIPNSLFNLYKDNLVYLDTDQIFIYNYNSGNKIAIEYEIENLNKLYVANNYIVAISKTDDLYNIDFIDFNSNKFKTAKLSNYIIFRKQNGDLDILNNNSISYRGKQTLTLDTNYIQAQSESLYYISENKLYKQYLDDDPIEIADADQFYTMRKFSKEYIVFEYEDQLFAYIEEDIWPLDVDYDILLGFTDDYVITSDSVVVTAYSNEPDIILNYPDNTYYSLLAYQLALSFVAKQGGDPTILSSQFDKAKFDFENNAQDAFTSVRIKNVYK